MLCGYNKCPDALQFHHVGDDKYENVSIMAGRGNSYSKLRTEIEKCVVVCANCHAEIHASRVKPDGITKRTSKKSDTQLGLGF